jgi:hypothetical protein
MKRALRFIGRLHLPAIRRAETVAMGYKFKTLRLYWFNRLIVIPLRTVKA